MSRLPSDETRCKRVRFSNIVEVFQEETEETVEDDVDLPVNSTRSMHEELEPDMLVQVQENPGPSKRTLQRNADKVLEKYSGEEILTAAAKFLNNNGQFLLEDLIKSVC